MKITKYLHSCLVFELDGYKLLFDPGNFTFAEGLVKPEDFADVQGMVITHIHPDHYYPENIKKILAINDMPVYTTAEVNKALAKEDIKSTAWGDSIHYIGPFKLQAISVIHEPLLDNPIPQMLGFIINDKVLHPVDSMEDALLKYNGIELLILVAMAPFANELRIAGFADKIHPQQILPVHDGYAKDFFIKQRYANYSKHFKNQGIMFHEIYQPGNSISI
ncbi:MAG TPA: MBL fold metallo-hydrolase [Mucilaginibacter sp.]